MANIDRIVNVQISLNTAAVNTLSFSDMLLLTPGSWPNRVEIITSADQLLAAPFSLGANTNVARAARIAFSQTPTLRQLYIGRIDAGDTTAALTMAAIAAVNNGWYGFIDCTNNATRAPGHAAWAEANKKLFFAGVNTADGVTSTLTDVAGVLKTGNYFRSAVWHSAGAADFVEVAAMAKAFTKPAGSETFANMTLAGVPSTNLTETQKSNVFFRNANTFEPFRSVNLTQNGKTAGGEWIDIIRGRDWLEEEIKVEVFNSFIDRRIPFTDAGISIIKQGVVSALSRAQRRGFVALDLPNELGTGFVPGFQVAAPRISDISVADKAARILRGVTFKATLQNAVHTTEINGSLTYDFEALTTI